MVTYTDATALVSQGYSCTPSFFLEVREKVGTGRILCREILRILPGRRLVFRGQWHERLVVVKVYLARGTAQRHVDREMKGVNALKAAGARTPRVLLETSLSGDGSPVLVFEELPAALTLSEAVVQAKDPATQETLLRQAVQTVAALHEGGLVQRDIHPANFLFSGDELYTIDADSVDTRRAGTPLGQWPSLVNLGLFFAQFSGNLEPFFSGLYRDYARARRWDESRCSFPELQRHIAEQWELRKGQYLRKIFRSSTEHICQREWSRYSVWERGWDGDDLRSFLANPDGYLEGGEVLKDGRSSTVVAVLMNGCRVAVKRYNLKNPWHVLRRCLRSTRAAVSWRNAHLLGMMGVRTPDPVLLLENRWGIFRGSSYFVSRYVEGRPYQKIFEGPFHEAGCGRDPRVQEFVRMLILLRKHRLSHGDMKSTNFIESDRVLWVMDLDAMKEHGDEASHRRALAKDCARWMQNWKAHPKVSHCFREALQEAGFL